MELGMSSAQVRAFHLVTKSMFLIGDFSAAAELLVSGLQELRNIEQFVFTMDCDGTYSNPQDMDSKAASLELTKSCLQNFSMIQ